MYGDAIHLGDVAVTERAVGAYEKQHHGVLARPFGGRVHVAVGIGERELR